MVHVLLRLWRSTMHEQVYTTVANFRVEMRGVWLHCWLVCTLALIFRILAAKSLIPCRHKHAVDDAVFSGYSAAGYKSWLHNGITWRCETLPFGAVGHQEVTSATTAD